MQHAEATENPQLLLAHVDFVRALAWHLVREEHAAEDVAQDTWVSALEHPPRPGPVRGWLARVARNHVFMKRRGDGRRARREQESARSEPLPSTAEIYEREAARREVVEALVALEEPYRSTILLRYYEDLSLREVARRLAVPLETVRTRQKRGLALLRAKLDRRHGDDRAAWIALLLPLASPPRPRSGSLRRRIGEGAALSARWKLAAGGALAAGALLVSWRFLAPLDGVDSVAFPTAEAASLAGPEVARAAAPVAEGERRAAPAVEPASSAPTSSPSVAAPTSRVRGRVLDEDGAPAAGARVLVFHTLRPHVAGGEPVEVRASVETRSDGSFEVGELPREFYLHVERGGLVADAGLAASLPAPREIDGVELHLARAVRVRGRVVDSDGAPVAGASLQAKTHDRRGRGRSAGTPGASYRSMLDFTCVSASDGSFELEGLPPVRHVLSAEGAGFLTSAQELVDPSAAVTCVLQRGASLSVRVLDVEGRPLAGASVQLGGPVLAATSDADGRCTFAPVADGAREFVRAQARACATVFSEPVEVAAGSRELVVRMRAARAIAGRVVDASGEAVEGARVVALARIDREPPWKELWSRNLDPLLEVAAATTDASGAFALEGLDEGRFDLHVTPLGALAAEGFVEAAAGDDEVRVRLGATADGSVAFEGSVRDALTGEPVPKFALTASEDLRDAAHPPLVKLVDDPQGRFALAARDAGSWSLTVRAEGYAPWRTELASVAAGTRRVEVELAPARDLELRVVDRRGEPVPSARVVCSDADGRALPTMISLGYWLNTARVGPDARIRLSGLPARAIVIRVRLPERLESPEFPFDLRRPIDGVVELRLDCDASSPRRTAVIALRERGSDGVERWLEGRFEARVLDESGAVCASFAGEARDGRCALERPMEYLIERYTPEGALHDHGIEELDGDPVGESPAILAPSDGRTEFQVPVPLGRCRVVVTADGGRRAERELDARGASVVFERR